MIDDYESCLCNTRKCEWWLDHQATYQVTFHLSSPAEYGNGLFLTKEKWLQLQAMT